jgi:hypothetical protein
MTKKYSEVSRDGKGRVFTVNDIAKLIDETAVLANRQRTSAEGCGG